MCSYVPTPLYTAGVTEVTTPSQFIKISADVMAKAGLSKITASSFVAELKE